MHKDLRRLVAGIAGLFFLALISPRGADALSITWDTWNLGSPVVTATAHGVGSGSAAANQLMARAAVTTLLLDATTWGNENSSTSISLSNSFTVQPDIPYQVGLSVDGLLTGSLVGLLSASGLNIPLNLLGSYTVSVNAAVDAGFASWNSPVSGHTITGGLLQIGTYSLPVSDIISVPGTLIIGQTYPFTMNLVVSVQKNDSYSVVSDFESLNFNADKLTADVAITGEAPLPEPSTVVLWLLGVVGGVPLLKRFHSQHRQG